ncbi:MAG: DUF4397 domain-containing protein [Halohasta sp.]
MNDSRRRDFLKVAGGVAVAGGLAGCAGEAQEEDGDGNETDEEPTDPEPEDESPAEDDQPAEEETEDEAEDEETEATGDDLIRIAHMIPDFPAVDVYVDDGEEPVVGDLEYTDVTGYLELAAGDHQIRVTAAGAQSLVVFDEQVSVPAGNTTAVALGDPDSGDGEAGEDAGSTDIGFQLELYPDDNEPPAESINDARLRLIHASPDAPAVDVLVGQTPVFEDVAFSEAEYFDLPAGDYEFNVLPAGGGAAGDGGSTETENGGENESEDGGLFSDLAADGGSDIGFLQADNESNETVPEEDEAEDEETEDQAVFSFDASPESNGVYTAFATGYLDAEAAGSDAEFEVVITQEVVDGDPVEAEDD